MKLFGAKESDSRPVLYVVEPFNFLLTNWQKARVVGQENKTEEMLALFAAGHTDATNPLTSLATPSQPPVKADLIESTSLPLLGERRVFEQDRKTISVVVGLPAETKGLIVAGPLSSVSAAIDDVKTSDAEAHGLLALIVGSRSISEASKNSTHHYLGTVLYEPSVQAWHLPTDTSAIFLSLLSPELLAHYWTHYFPDTEPELVTATDILSASPTQAEWLLNKANIIGSASLRDRYQLLNLLDKHYRCRLFSKNLADKQLSESYQF